MIALQEIATENAYLGFSLEEKMQKWLEAQYQSDSAADGKNKKRKSRTSNSKSSKRKAHKKKGHSHGHDHEHEHEHEDHGHGHGHHHHTEEDEILGLEVPVNRKFILEATKSEIHKFILKVAYCKSASGAPPQ